MSMNTTHRSWAPTSFCTRAGSQVYRAIRRIFAYFPSKLPLTDAQFEAWYADIAYLYDLPQNNDSVRFALGTIIMHLGPLAFYTPKRDLGLTLLKGAAQQQAYNIMSDVKARQEAAKKASPPQLAAVSAPTGADGGPKA